MRLVLLLLVSLAFSAVLSIAACGPVQADCSPQNCDGCCSDTGRCQLGQQAAACGTSGQACTSCNAAQMCQAGACVPFSGTDGGCNGCRDAQGTCHAGQSEMRCGSGGAQCVSCAGGESCQGGACVQGGCKTEGAQCILNGECCTNLCSPAGTCAPRPDAGVDGGEDDGGLDAGEDAGHDGGLDAGGVDAGPACTIDPCMPSPGPATANCACVQSVCAQDPFCCNTQWDSICSDTAGAMCSECGGGGDGGSCLPDGWGCQQNSDCCGKVCDPSQGVCGSGASDGGPTCLPEGSGCFQHSDCCNNICDPSLGFCWSGGGTDGGMCKPDGFACQQDPDCCNFSCLNGVCDSGSAPVTCGKLGTTCATPNDCCSATCDQGACVPNPNGGAVSCGAVTNICVVSGGPASPPSCDPCVQSICNYDPYCCSGSWDSLCANEAAFDCDGRCP
jgi:hypothetical protein